MANNSELEVHGIAPRRSGRDTKVGSEGRLKASSRSVRSALNCLIVAGRGEIIALDAGARVVDDTERRTRLREQAQRRAVFRRDLAAAVTALGGVPAPRATGSARFAAGARRVRELMIGPHEGDAYAACAHATEMTVTAYAKALKLELPADVKFGVERQYAEIEWDWHELRRLRWGAALSPLPDPGRRGPPQRAPGKLDEERALGAWSNEGGSAARLPGGAENAGPGVAPATR